ncbi:GCN5 family acetyltransferase [Corynebacterium pseudotuberculosis]|uniref:GCN5 family acetyltransferase n=1 Tax=Corynebacterium pseudotuberculosis TaxID=1719 RepID=UPI000A5ED9A9|nr:GCN5 family acetyltransferase [Corynebacterium pseudotuberculosis]WAE78300.1 GCN5 family acetyltransferase [Corynebacterium pseudotuberculosis]WAE80349.1 GCN5 family acetyltransferase [Corynebacterium pseudotuberculosis]WAE82398.1 GCN5 family acetyltransferase [Corynebacterium pseudotuberculosis]WAE84445.1 GCN5 family acetyltransferase [Corynebacterium pseudotuberculosis]WAE86496.1 GCN5 family acetyltransferase [Corynebacterium pseudotuberculosis]
MMERLQLKVLQQVKIYVTPFQAVEGFTHRWWHGIAEDAPNRKEYIQFLIDGEEVGRAAVTNYSLPAHYVGIGSEVTTKEIEFFEIRQDLRRRHYGAEFARHLISHYTGYPLIAFSEGADEFWAEIGWHYYPRKDGDPHYCKLFVSQKIGE